MARELLTKKLLDDKLAVRPQRQIMIWDAKETGLSVLVSRGPKHKRQATLTFRVVYYLKTNPGKPRYKALGRYDSTSGEDIIHDMRDAARLVRIDAQKGGDPKRPKLTGRFKETVDKFIEDHAKQNRTWAETKRIFDHYIVPEWADKNIEGIVKGDVSELLAKIARGKIDIGGENYGTPAVARATRAQLVTLFTWWEANYSTDAYRSPIVKVMKSNRTLQAPGERERDLEDDEIRALWTACGSMGAYGAAVRFALLSAQRFRKVIAMRRSDLKDHMRVQGNDIGNVWDPTREDDPKNKRVSIVPLSRLARQVLNAVPSIDDEDAEDFVFTVTGRGPLNSLSKSKARLDCKMLALLRQEAEARGENPDQVGEWNGRTQRVKAWQARDLRRTSRTMMARIGISNEVAEHCLAHAMPRIQRTYNRYGYLPEKRAAFEKLAEHIERIVNPAGSNVVAIPTRTRPRR